MGNDCPVCRGKISPSLFSMPIRYDLDIHMQCPEDYADECADMVDRDHFRKSYIKGQGFLSDLQVQFCIFNSEPTKSKPTLRRSKRTTREKYYWIYEVFFIVNSMINITFLFCSHRRLVTIDMILKMKSTLKNATVEKWKLVW